jgi:hypothetical protein
MRCTGELSHEKNPSLKWLPTERQLYYWMREGGTRAYTCDFWNSISPSHLKPDPYVGHRFTVRTGLDQKRRDRG